MKNLFLINTPYHFIVSYVFARHIDSTFPGSKNVFVFIEDRPDTVKPIYDIVSGQYKHFKYETHFINASNKKASSILFFKKRIQKLISNNYLNEMANNIFFFADHVPGNIIFLEMHPENSKKILIEEGIGPYNPLKIAKATFLRRIKRMIKKTVGYPNSDEKPFGQVWIPDISLVSNADLITTEYSKGAEIKSLPKGDFFYSYRNELISILKVDVKSLYSERGAILYLSQPLQGSNIISSEVEEEFLLKLIKTFKNNNMNVVVKLHPAETKERVAFYENMGFKTLRTITQIPVDIIFSIIKPKAVVTPMSSAALNYYFRENGTVIWLEKLLLGTKTSKFKIVEEQELIKKPKDFNDFSLMLKELTDDKNIESASVKVEDIWTEFIKGIIED